MKTAISIPAPLFEAAEKFASSMSLSRSKLYTLALEEYLQTHQKDQMTQQLNAVYTDENSSLDPFFIKLQIHTLSEENDHATW